MSHHTIQVYFFVNLEIAFSFTNKMDCDLDLEQISIIKLLIFRIQCIKVFTKR